MCLRTTLNKSRGPGRVLWTWGHDSRKALSFSGTAIASPPRDGMAHPSGSCVRLPSENRAIGVRKASCLPGA